MNALDLVTNLHRCWCDWLKTWEHMEPTKAERNKLEDAKHHAFEAAALAGMRALVAEIEKCSIYASSNRSYWLVPVQWLCELKAALEEK